MIKCLAAFYLWILSLRYRIHVTNEKLLHDQRASLFLSNHQAEIDPQILMSIILKYKFTSPLISASYYNLPIVKWVMKIINAVKVSDLDNGSRDYQVMNSIHNATFEALNRGTSILLYPSGQLANQAYEIIKNKQSAYVIVKELDINTPIVGVRMHGLWGSMWSKAKHGVSPPFFKTFFKGLLYYLLNLVFFIPKRDVYIEFIDLSTQIRAWAANANRHEFNYKLESFYNEKGEDSLKIVPHHFLLNINKKENKNS
jgi:long-chain-fatty-acid--[acyl-carrier-protein] ligase